MNSDTVAGAVVQRALIIAVLLIPGVAFAQDWDFAASDISFTQTGPDEYDVSVLVEFSANDLATPEFMEVELLVNGGTVGFFGRTTATRVFCNATCDSNCELTINGTNRTGTCIDVPILGCYCVVVQFLDPFTSVIIPPGALVEARLDPGDLVVEFDETNNEIAVILPPPVPALSSVLLVVLTGLLIVVGMVLISRNRRQLPETAAA